MSTHLHIRGIARIVGVAVAVAVVLAIVLPAYWQWRQPVLKDGSKLVAAVQAFAADRRAHGQPLPSSVSLRELVRDGFISADDVHAFDGMEATLSMTADEKYPQAPLMTVRFQRGGGGIVVLGDGSVQQVTSARLRDMGQH